MEKTSLSASKINTLNQCSFLFYAKYILRVPDNAGENANRGTVVHTVFECLINPRHRHHYDAIIAQNGIPPSSPVLKLIRKNTKKFAIDTPEHLEMIRDMVLVGLKFDFFVKGGTVIGKEMKVKLEGKNYKLTGYIDLAAKMADGTALVRDYKSSKAKFAKADLSNNIQGLAYSLAMKRLYNMNSLVQFVFVRFPKAPNQEVSFSEAELSGFESYLEWLGEWLKDYDINRAKSDYAADDFKRRFFCGSDTPGKWICSMRKPCVYRGLFNAEGELLSTYPDGNDSMKGEAGQYIERITHFGCPRFKKYEEI
jgi:hypothetical protein